MVHGIASQSSCEDEELALFQRDLSLSERSKAVMLQPPEKEKSFLLSNVSGVHSVAAGFARPDIAGFLSISSSSRRAFLSISSSSQQAARGIGLMMRERNSFIARFVIIVMMFLLCFMAFLLWEARETRQPVEDPRLPARNDSRWQKASDDKPSLQQSLFAATRTNPQLGQPASSRDRPNPESYRIYTPSPSTVIQGSLPQSYAKQAMSPDASLSPRHRQSASVSPRHGQSQAMGKYIVEIDGLRVNKEFSRFSDMVQTLARGTKIKILEISDKEEKGRVRARIQDPAGWISYRNGSNYFVKKVQEATNDFPIAEEQHPPDISSASSIATGSRTNRQRMRVSAEQELVRMVSPFAGNAVPPVDSAGNPVPPDPVPSVESHIFGHVNTVRSFNRRLLEMVRTGDKAAILDLYEREEPQILLEAYCDMVDNFFPNRKALDRFKIKFYAVCPKEDFMELVRRRGEPVMESLYLGDSSSMDEIRATMDIVATIDY